MSHHQSTGSAHWTCQVCRLSTIPALGTTAAAETTYLAAVHDRIHHGGSRTAEVRLAEEFSPRYAAAS